VTQKTFKRPLDKKRKNYWCVREKIDKFYITMYASRFEKRVWNIGLSICKSKRAGNDWYHSRHTKRTRRLDGAQVKKTPATLICRSMRLMYQICKNIPEGHWIVIDPTTARKSIIPRYMIRIGFFQYKVNGRWVWALKAPVKVVDGYRS